MTSEEGSDRSLLRKTIQRRREEARLSPEILIILHNQFSPSPIDNRGNFSSQKGGLLRINKASLLRINKASFLRIKRRAC
jgi:hypothetical protein